MVDTPKTALVLSGGGVRGAYEVGVVMGIVETLGLKPDDAPPFQLFAGTSVGAINAAYMVSRSERGDLGISELAAIWSNLNVTAHLRLNLRRKRTQSEPPRGLTKSLIDPRPLELLVRRSLDWDMLHLNLERGHALALLVAAFNLASGRTNIFIEKHPSTDFRPSPDPLRVARVGPVTADHVLASAAIPLLFPARPLEGSYFCDGGVRFNTPISPAIRAGADRLVVISLERRAQISEAVQTLETHPSPQFIAGKLLDALLLDPFSYDLDVMERFNDLFSVLEDVLPPHELQRVHSLMERRRNARYRQLKALVFTPSTDIGRLANEHLRDHLDKWSLSRIPRFLMRRAALQDATWEADWAAYMLFDGGYAGKLISLGLEDARLKASEIREFFAAPILPRDGNS